MEIVARIKRLRKEILKLNQTEFARRIHISRANLGSIEIGRINVTDRVVHDICREFAVNEDWLRRGTEPVFQEDGDPFTDEIVRVYLTLNEDNRKYLRGYMHRLLEEQDAGK